jgi:hypothetical protein
MRPICSIDVELLRQAFTAGVDRSNIRVSIMAIEVLIPYHRISFVKRCFPILLQYELDFLYR